MHWKISGRNRAAEKVTQACLPFRQKIPNLRLKVEWNINPGNSGDFGQNVNGETVILAQPTGKFPKQTDGFER